MLIEPGPVCVATTGSFGAPVAVGCEALPTKESHAPPSSSDLWEQDARPEGRITDVRPVSRHVRSARSVFLSGDLSEGSLRGLLVHYSRWVEEPTYLAFRDVSADEYFFRMASKRGNSVYSARVRGRVEDATRFLDSPSFSGLVSRRVGRGYVSNAFFFTMTCNPGAELYDRRRAWKSIQYRYNRFISAIRKRYGRVYCLKTFESTCDGYPHVHCLVIFEKPLPVFEHNGKWRLKSKRSIERLWYSNLDIMAIGPGRGGVRSVKAYLLKDVVKQARYEPGLDFSQTNLSLALNWIFRKRSFSVSNPALIYDLINEPCITQTDLGSLDLLDGRDIRFLGCFRLSLSCEIGDRMFFYSVLGDEVRNSDAFSWLVKHEAQ